MHTAFHNTCTSDIAICLAFPHSSKSGADVGKPVTDDAGHLGTYDAGL